MHNFHSTITSNIMTTLPFRGLLALSHYAFSLFELDASTVDHETVLYKYRMKKIYTHDHNERISTQRHKFYKLLFHLFTYLTCSHSFASFSLPLLSLQGVISEARSDSMSSFNCCFLFR